MDRTAIGTKCVKEEIVTYDLTAKCLGSGGLEVYATPAMIRLMEYTAWQSVEPLMDEDKTSVGTRTRVDHISASPMGASIICESELIDVDDRKLTFSVACYDDAGLIGEGIHERFIVKTERFLQRIHDKMAKIEDEANAEGDE